MHPLIETHRTALLALALRRGVTGVRVFGSMSRADGNDATDNSDEIGRASCRERVCSTV